MKWEKVNDYCYTCEDYTMVRAMFGGVGIVTVWKSGECVGTFNTSKSATAFLSGSKETDYSQGNHSNE